MWQPDGWGWRARLGVLAPHGDIGPECEFRAMAPDGVSTRAARIPRGVFPGGGRADRTSDPIEHHRASAAPPPAEAAAEPPAAAPLQAIVFAFTSSSYVRGADEDAALRARPEARTQGVPVVVACAPAVPAPGVLGARRAALISPPWLAAAADRPGAEYFRSRGFEVGRGGAGRPAAGPARDPLRPALRVGPRPHAGQRPGGRHRRRRPARRGRGADTSRVRSITA